MSVLISRRCRGEIRRRSSSADSERRGTLIGAQAIKKPPFRDPSKMARAFDGAAVRGVETVIARTPTTVLPSELWSVIERRLKALGVTKKSRTTTRRTRRSSQRS